MKKLLCITLALVAFIFGLQAAQHGQKAKVKPPDGFVALFDGNSLDGWFTNPDNSRDTWSVDPESRVLARNLKNGYIWTEKQYGDFVLDLEYKLSRRCNSGVFYRFRSK